MGTRIEQLERQVEVLREALCDSGSESASRALYAADRIDDEPVEATVPAPTWRPIAELPEEWRDGRDVVFGVGTDRYTAGWDGAYWVTDDGTVITPRVFLDLAIPEVPRG